MTDWPVELVGVTESVVTTLGPNGKWNAAALGLHASESGGGDEDGDEDGGGGDGDAERGDSDGERGQAPRVTSKTWGNTRTRRNFHRQGGGYVQFTRDPLTFVNAALSIHEVDDPVLDGADAWVEIETERVASGESGGTRWEEWEHTPVAVGVEREVVPVTNRGFAAVVEATVAASRLDVDAYDTADLLARLDYFESVADTCGGERVRRAFDRLLELADVPEDRS